ncbi:MAG: cysteine--tRNA ligase [Nanoarchaeota archaeon]|nr:cysteine--tRNA ligase [Nanoarchaeota archaeon]MBU4451282.1 cysteine--tRNA ligase [Nanoarchaeota archaeon]MCG2723571.1 cysteine--tRNA ligase [archaeon]
MSLKFFNTMTRKKEAFKPIKAGFAGFYTCGPTVYNFAHIGNFRTYVFEDILRRTLKMSGLAVKQVMNITDVEDKIIKACREQKVGLKEFTEKYTNAFFEDLKTLGIEPAEVYPKATETIPEMVAMIKTLMEKGIAYRGDDGSIYYSILKFKDYGNLAHIDVKSLKAGARVKQDEYSKDDAQDFALWKAWDANDGDIFWETELGKGRPGWHIECSAMSIKNLGETFDIHTGAVDNIFPHHQNEIAQSEGATGKKFVNYWVHSEHLLVENKKMSKSLGNFFTLRDVLAKGYNPRGLRYLLLSSHYRQKLNFTFGSLDAAENTVSGLIDFVDKLDGFKSDATDNKTISESAKKSLETFKEAMQDDLDTPKALQAMFDLVSVANKAIEEKNLSTANAAEVLEAMNEFDKILGVLAHEKVALTDAQKALVEKRQEARKNKDWKTADEIRKELGAQGILLEDAQGGGVRMKKKQ